MEKLMAERRGSGPPGPSDFQTPLSRRFAAVSGGIVRCPSDVLESRPFGAAVLDSVAVSLLPLLRCCFDRFLWIHFELASLCHVCAFGIAAHACACACACACTAMPHMCARSRLIAALVR